MIIRTQSGNEVLMSEHIVCIVFDPNYLSTGETKYNLYAYTDVFDGKDVLQFLLGEYDNRKICLSVFDDLQNKLANIYSPGYAGRYFMPSQKKAMNMYGQDLEN